MLTLGLGQSQEYPEASEELLNGASQQLKIIVASNLEVSEAIA